MSRYMRVVWGIMVLASLSVLASCGGGSGGTLPPPPVVNVSISPTTKTIAANETAQFTAAVTGTSNTAVTWTASSGTVVNGLYTPPSQTGTYTVTATSQADTSKSANATVTVTEAVVHISISPTTKTISVTDTFQFTANVTGTSNTAVTWSASAGTVADGLFTPPMHSGSYTVTATSQADTSKSATANVTVTAPAPVFSSTPPTIASENTAYSYSVVVTDPAGTAVTLSLTGPDGATLTGNTVNWTPSTAQARVSNSFSLTATTAAGGTGTQPWTVTPAGTIRGSWIDKYWIADGTSIDVARDVAAVYIAALIPQQDGTLTEIPGTGHVDGTFTIPDVPGGHYWLVFDDEHYWTESCSFDLGSDYTGRPYDPNEQVNTAFDFDLTGLVAPQTPGLSVELVSPNANSLYYTFNRVNSGVTSFNFVEVPSDPVTAIDPSRGDTTYVLQQDASNLPSGKGTFIGVSSALLLNSLATIPDGSTPVAGALGGTPTGFTFNLKGSDWANLLTTAGPVTPDTMTPVYAEVSILPFVTDKYAWPFYYRETTIASITANTSVDESFGPFGYVNPYPSAWKRVFMATQTATFPITLPGATLPGSYQVTADFWTDTIPTGPIAPLMSAVRNPKINNVDFFNPSSGSSPVTISWTPPTGLAPYAYEIAVSTFTSNYQTIAYLYTATTSIEVPSVLLDPGSSYVFTIRAIADSRANVEMYPWRSGLPIADASIVSGVFTLSGTASPNSVANRVKSSKTRLLGGELRHGRELRFMNPTTKPQLKP